MTRWNPEWTEEELLLAYWGFKCRLSYLQAIENGEDVSGHEPYKEVVEAFRESPEEFDRKCQWIMQTYGVQWPEP